MNKEIFNTAYNKIRAAENILLVTHNKPDGDALSSICAMLELCSIEKKRVTAFCVDQPSSQFAFLPHLEKVISDRSSFNFFEHDLIIALDCGQLSRTGLTTEISNRDPKQFVIEIDHHPKVRDYADLEIRDPYGSSTAEIIYRFLRSNEIKINKNLANCILTGILTDTGNLLYESTSDQTIQIASEMITRGARFPKIVDNTWRNKSLDAMKVWGEAMKNLVINEKYQVAFSVLTRDMIEGRNVSDEELEGLSGFLNNLYGIKALLLLREEKDANKIKGSLRTADPHVNVSALARHLGGGGHIRASGFMLEGQLVRENGIWQIK